MPLSKGGDLVMALKKSDFYGSLWKGADELRGGMDASQYKGYVLTLLFVKYVTDKAKSNKNSLIDVPIGGAFDDLITFKGDKEIGDKLHKAIGKLAEANDLQKVIDLADFNDEEKLGKGKGKGKEMQDRLTNLISIFQDLDFRGSHSVLADYLALSEEEATANTKLKSAQENLMEKVFQQYANFTEDDIKTLVVDNKWLAILAAAVQGELDRVSQTLTGRIRQPREGTPHKDGV